MRDVLIFFIAAIADASGTFIINGNFQASPPGTYRGAGTVFVYSIDSNGRERITAEGPLQQQIVVYVCLIFDRVALLRSFVFFLS